LACDCAQILMEESTTECLYYRAFRSYLLQSPDFKTDFHLLQKQQSDFPDSFKVLNVHDQVRLKQMQSAYCTGRFVLFEGSTFDFAKVILPELEKSEKPHRELVIDVYKNRKTILEPYTGPIKDACFEYPVLDGSIDLMVQSGLCAYVVEIKTDTADHSIIGQVMKYYVGMCLKLSLKFFNEVKIITVCPGYDQASHRGLKQIGATVLSINPKTSKTALL